VASHGVLRSPKNVTSVTKYAKRRIHLCSVMFVRFISFCVKCHAWQYAVQQLSLGRYLPLSVTNVCQLYVNIYLLRRGTNHAWELCTHLCLFFNTLYARNVYIFQASPSCMPWCRWKWACLLILSHLKLMIFQHSTKWIYKVPWKHRPVMTFGWLCLSAVYLFFEMAE
jgi:hypothetical protein